MYSYTGDFQWQKGYDLFGNLSLNGQVYDLGNTISNANTHNFNGVLDMSKFYRYIGLVKNNSAGAKSGPGFENSNTSNNKTKKKASPFVNSLI